MKNEKFVAIFENIDDDILRQAAETTTIEDFKALSKSPPNKDVTKTQSAFTHEKLLGKQLSKSKNKKWIKLTAIASCITLFICMGLVFLPQFIRLIGPQENRLDTLICIIDNRIATYEIIDNSDRSIFSLENKKGEYFDTVGKYSVYKIKDHKDILYLIFDDGNTIKYCQFIRFFYDDEWLSNEEFRKGLKTSDWYKKGFLNDDTISTLINAPYSFQYVLETIYGITSSLDIVSVKFDKANFDNTKEGKAVKIEAVTLNKQEDIYKMYNILCSLQRTPGDDIPEEKNAKEQQFKKNGNLLIKVSRVVTISLANGESIEFQYSSVANALYESGMVLYNLLEENDNNWLISVAKIDY